MQRERLTPTRIDAFTCLPDKAQAFLWDSECPRLAVRATAAGSKSYIFQGKLDGQTIRITIGDVKTWPLESVWEGRGTNRREVQRGARQEAARLQALIDQGIDPRDEERQRKTARAAQKAAEERAKREAEERQKYTLRALCEAYANHLDAQGKTKSAASARSAFACHLYTAHPGIADTPARDVTATQMATVVRKVMERGKERTAGVLRSYLLAAYNAARRAPFDARLPSSLIHFGIVSNPVEVVTAIPVKAGDRTLNTGETKTYQAALGDDPDMIDNALLLALLSGGQRMAQLLRAKVTDYDPHTQTLRLWDGKGKRTTPREHLLPLGPRAAALVERLVRRAKSKESPWLLSVHGKVPITASTPGKRVAEISEAMQCCSALQSAPFDLRDIRRTVETMLAGMGISRDVRAQLLSHGISGVQAAHYDRHAYLNEKRAALAAWEAHLGRIVADAGATTNVIPLKRPT